MAFNNTQLTSVNGFKISNLLFGKVRDGGNGTARLPIGIKNADGSAGELILETPDLYSFGLSENMKFGTKEADGSYSVVLCLQDKSAPTDEQTKWVDTFNSIVENIKKHLVDNRVSIKKYDLELSDLRKFNPIFIKKDKITGQVAPDASPMLYVKVIQDKKTGRIDTPFETRDGKEVDPMTLLGKHCNIRAAIKIESVHIGNRISLQVKLYGAEVQVKDTGIKRLLRRPVANDNVVMDSNPDEEDNKDVVDEDDKGSVKGSDDEEEDEEKEEVKPAPVAAAPAVSAPAKPARRPVNRKA
jgi:hypothetical protein